MNRLLPLLALLLFGAFPAFAEESKTEKELLKKYEQLLKERPEIRRKLESGQTTKAQIIEWMRNGGDQQKSKGKRYGGKGVQIKDPAGFKKASDKPIFSGPQQGEMLPPLKVIGLGGKLEGIEHDPNESVGDKPQVLIFQNESIVGLKGLYLFGPVLNRIASKAKSGLHLSTVFLSDDPSSLFKGDSNFARKLTETFPMAYSVDGRDGPGAYGLNRNVAMTILVAKNGRVVHNFAFTQPMLYADAHVLGGIADAIGEERQTVAAWFDEQSKADEKMMRKQDK